MGAGNYYEGAFYGRVLEPLQRGLHAVVAREIAPGERVLDAGSGAGGLALRLARVASQVVGVDHAPAMVAWAERRRAREGVGNVRFVTGDVTRALADAPDGGFHAATLVLALHEMPTSARGPILRELCRLAARVVCLDFKVPMPWNLAGLRNRSFEVAAGRAHFRAYRDYVRRGGVQAIAAEAGVACTHVRDLDRGALTLVTLSARSDGAARAGAGPRG
jgi:ubiquinone/menaquinone biosynthesis C-methylase UbiE